MTFHRWAVLAIALALPAPAAAKSPKLSFRAYQVTAASGTERVDFAGDAAAGCAARGLCGISGSETYAPDTPGPAAVAFLVSFGKERLGTITLDAGSTTASVTTAGAEAPCTETLELGQVTASLAPARGGWLARLHAGLKMPGFAGSDDAVFATHCAGPRTADLAAAHALPRATVSNASLARRTLTVDLVADKAFSAAGFAGRVVADVRLTLRRVRQPSGTVPSPKIFRR
jgi:hypothetical protein